MDEQNKTRVLLVDDEAPIVMALEFLLEREGYLVETALNGLMALDRMKVFRPDILVLDVMMPGMNGYEVAQMVRNDPEYEKVKIVFLTAKGATGDKMQGYDSGAEYYLLKPFDNREFVEVIHEIASYG